MVQLQNTTLARVMTARPQIVTVSVDADARHIEDANRRTGRSRFPVVDPEDRMLGFVHVRDALRAMREGRAQLALVTDGADTVGLVALEDLLEEVIGEFDDETDTVTGHPTPLSAQSAHP